VAAEVAPFGIGVTIVEPGGARTEFRYGSARVAELMPEYDGNPAHAFQRMLDPANGLAPGDPARMAARIIDSVDTEPAPLRLMLGSQALESTIAALRARIADFEKQADLAVSTDFPPGEKRTTGRAASAADLRAHGRDGHEVSPTVQPGGRMNVGWLLGR
jgi:NAD(P)-dependent dehydrogenase (short-subunit alcohol dehydrogenase family)